MADRPPSRKSRPTTISIPEKLHADLVAMADRSLSSVSQVVRALVQEGLAREKRDAGRRQGRADAA